MSASQWRKMIDVLITEDEDILRRNLMVILNSAGYNTVAANNGADAIGLLKRRRFDLVITDLIMPYGAGEEVMRYITDNLPDTEIIIITAYPSIDNAVEALKVGVADYFIKPFKTPDLIKSIERIFEKRKGIPLLWEKFASYELTRKENDLLKLIVEHGVTENTELADRLEIKITTLKQHFTNLYAKFGVKNKSSLISKSMEILRNLQ